eukprot:6863425-Pyramimonas_sp.AAC.1
MSACNEACEFCETLPRPVRLSISPPTSQVFDRNAGGSTAGCPVAVVLTLSSPGCFATEAAS